MRVMIAGIAIAHTMLVVREGCASHLSGALPGVALSAEVWLREFRRQNWFLVECLPCRMSIVCCAKDAEVFRVVGSAERERFDVVDLEIVGGVAYVA